MAEPSKSLGEQNYEQFADRYAATVLTKAHNAYYNRPAILSLMPDVAGLKVLDAGCGSGLFTEWLLDRGAQVVACDVTPRMVEITQQRMGDRAVVRQADLTQPLAFAADRTFDLVLCSLVLDHIAVWLPVFFEFYRVLQPGGWVIFSCGHPMSDFLYTQQRQLTPGQYFEVEQFSTQWKGFGEPHPVVTSYRRSLQATLNPLVQAGFCLDRILEPQPTEQFQQADPENYDKLMREPGFLCVRGRKPSVA